MDKSKIKDILIVIGVSLGITLIGAWLVSMGLNSFAGRQNDPEAEAIAVQCCGPAIFITTAVITGFIIRRKRSRNDKKELPTE